MTFEKCMICLREDNEEDILIDKLYTNCNHLFCKSCLEGWIKINKMTCPICRCDIKHIKENGQVYKIFKV